MQQLSTPRLHQKPARSTLTMIMPSRLSGRCCVDFFCCYISSVGEPCGSCATWQSENSFKLTTRVWTDQCVKRVLDSTIVIPRWRSSRINTREELCLVRLWGWESMVEHPYSTNESCRIRGPERRCQQACVVLVYYRRSIHYTTICLALSARV